jgi:phenylacetate-CoA ligase
MITVRGVNVFPSAVENIIRRFNEVDEFRVTVYTVRHMDEMDVEVELVEDADPNTVAAIGQAIDAMLAFRPNVRPVPRGTLPRFELKAKRFHVQRG